MLDIECFTYLNRALEQGPEAQIVFLNQLRVAPILHLFRSQSKDIKPSVFAKLAVSMVVGMLKERRLQL